MTENELSMPYLRAELIRVLQQLSDVDFQKRIWCRKKYDPKEWEGYSDFAHVIHFFYDDTHFSRDPSHYVGLCLLSEREARLIDAIITALNKVEEDIGFNVANETVIAHKKWPPVVEASRLALEALVS